MPGALSAGFCGKLPARGDFVRLGLPHGFVEPWDGWVTCVLTGSRALMGARWVPAWLEAPVWRFSLPPGTCGPGAVLGVMLPSVDRVGRYYPLTLATVFGPDCQPPAQEQCNSWLDECEEAGRAAVERDATPEQVAALLRPLDACGATAAPAASLWWTAGSPRVEAGRWSLRALPGPDAFATMLGNSERLEACE